MSEGRSVDWAAVATAGAVMAVIGTLDGLCDEIVTPKAVRAGWKTLLGVAGLYLNISSFSGGKFANESHLNVYVASMLATGAFALFSLKKY